MKKYSRKSAASIFLSSTCVLVSTFSAGSGAQAYSPPSYQVSFAATTFLVNGALTIDAKAPVDNHSALVVGGNGGVNVLGNNGSGAFASIASLPAAAAASLPGIALGDFNSDGIDDIAALGFILWGQSGNTYSQQNIAAPSGSGAVASGDINGDGISDLGFTQWGSNTVTIWLGGAGSPGSWVPATTPTQVPVGVNPFGLALGDLDGDGRAEIVSANGSNNSVTVYRGLSSAPYLTARADYTTAPGGYPTPDDITLADVNGDGSLDIVAVGRAPGQASTFLNNGSGIFGAAISSLIGPYNWDSRASAVADFNGDGLADIVVPIQWDLNAGPFNQVAVLLGDGTGHFEFEQDFAVGFGPYSQPTDVVAGDFNGDGRADFAVSNAGENSVTVMLNIPSVDTTAPVITVPADFTVEATGPSGAEVNWVTYASDNDDEVIIGCTPPWGSVFGLGTTKVECHATDSSGNIGYGSFRVSVVDTTAPIISVPADFTVEATGSSGAVVTYLASATDSVDGTVTTSCSSPSGSLFPFGFKTLVCSAVDAAGNSSSATFTVAVEDRTAPAVTASLVAIKKGGDDSSTQQFRVVFSATDSTGVTWLSTTLNGVAVQNGQIVELKTIKNGQQKVKSESNRLRIEATSFLLITTATDSSGNVGSANAVPVFNKNGKNN